MQVSSSGKVTCRKKSSSLRCQPIISICSINNLRECKYCLRNEKSVSEELKYCKKYNVSMEIWHEWDSMKYELTIFSPWKSHWMKFSSAYHIQFQISMSLLINQSLNVNRIPSSFNGIANRLYEMTVRILYGIRINQVTFYLLIEFILLMRSVYPIQHRISPTQPNNELAKTFSTPTTNVSSSLYI